MSLSDLAALGSFVSGAAVVVTLIFLLLQMRQSNRYQRSSMQLGRASRFSDLILRTTDPEVARVMTKAIGCDEPLSEVETRIFFGAVFTDFWNFEDTFLQHQASLLPSESMASDEGRLRILLLQPAYRAMWQLISLSFSEKFRAYVDGIMAQISPIPPFELSPTFRMFVREQLALAKPSSADPTDAHSALDSIRDTVRPGAKH
jgi:hypothetical protein